MANLAAELIELSKLKESPTNPRHQFNKTTLEELTRSIKTSGVKNPITVRPTDHENVYEIVVGSRRFRAAKAAGLATIPSFIEPMTDEEALEFQLIENSQREDVHPFEEAQAYDRLKAKFNYSIEQVASRVGKSPSHVWQRLTYINLIEPVRNMFLSGVIGPTHAAQIARLQPAQQKECSDLLGGPKIKQTDMTANYLRSEIKRRFFLVLKEAPFEPENAELLPKAGVCSACPKRTGFNKALFPDVKEDDVCTDPACFQAKTDAFIKAQVKANPNAVRLAICSSYESQNKKPTGITEWVKAGNERCPDTKQGVVVEKISHWPSQAQNVRLGSVLEVCTNPKCKIHHQAYRSSGGGMSEEQKANVRARKTELRRRGLVFKELAAEQFTVGEKDYRSILDWQITTLSHDSAKALCDAMGWEPAKQQWGKDYTKTIETKLAKLAEEGVENWLYLLMLANTELWYGNYGGSKPKLLEAKAKDAGVPLAEIAKTVKVKQKKIPKAKAKK